MPRLQLLEWVPDTPVLLADLLRGSARSLRDFQWKRWNGLEDPLPPELSQSLAKCVELRTLGADFRHVAAALDMQHLTSLTLVYRGSAEPVSDLLQAVRRHRSEKLSALRHLHLDLWAPAASRCGEVVVDLVKACPNVTSVRLDLTDLDSRGRYAKYVGEALACLPLLRSASIKACGVDVFPYLTALPDLQKVSATVYCRRSQVADCDKALKQFERERPQLDVQIFPSLWL